MEKEKEHKQIRPIPIKVKPYSHQIAAFNFVCKRFGLVSDGGDCNDKNDDEMRFVREKISTE